MKKREEGMVSYFVEISTDLLFVPYQQPKHEFHDIMFFQRL